jgi:creatinine amidohydrolase
MRTYLSRLLLLAMAISARNANSQTKLSTKWEELTAGDFREAIATAQGTCLLPFGILEKHGPHLPLGTDLLNVRYVSEHAAQQEYVIIFPQYYAGQIFEARHEPGTIAYSADLQMKLLQETTDEMARNGCKKVVIVNGHGGNENLLPYFAQSQLAKPHDYVVYVQWGHEATKKIGGEKNGPDWHAGETETSNMLATNPNQAETRNA